MAKYQLLVIANLLIYYYFYMLNFSVYNMFLCLWDSVINFGLTRCQGHAENVIKIFSLDKIGNSYICKLLSFAV